MWDGYKFKQDVRNALGYGSPLAVEVDNDQHPLGAALKLIDACMVRYSIQGAVKSFLEMVLDQPQQIQQRPTSNDWDQFCAWSSEIDGRLRTLQNTIDKAGGLDGAVTRMRAELETKFNSQLEAAADALSKSFSEKLGRMTQEMGTVMIDVHRKAADEFQKQIVDARKQFLEDLKTL